MSIAVPIRVVRRSTERAIQVILSEHPYHIVWLPRSAVLDGFMISEGERDIVIFVSEFIYEQNIVPTKKPSVHADRGNEYEVDSE